MESRCLASMMGGSESPSVYGARVLVAEFGSQDFRAVAVLVPGRRARRLLQRALLEQAKAAGGSGAVMAPRVVTPSALVETFFARTTHLKNAHPAIALLHWLDAFAALDPAGLGLLDPHGAHDRNCAALARVRQLRGVCEELDAIGVHPGEVPGRCGEVGSPERWLALGNLRDLAHAKMASVGLVESTVERRGMIDAGVLLNDAPSRLVVLGVSDPGVLACSAMQVLAERTTILIDCPESEADSFDEFGRPRPAAWNQRPSPIELSDMSLVERPIDAAEQVLDELTALNEEHGPSSPGEVVVGLCDESFSDLIERAGRRCGVPLRAAVGRSLAECEVAGVLEALRALLHDYSAESLSRILRMPSVEAMLAGDGTEDDLLALIDAWRSDRIGGTLEDLRSSNRGRRSLELAPLRDALCVLEELVQPIRVAESAHATCAALGVFLERLFAERLDDVQLHEELAPVEEILQTLASEPTGFAPSNEVVIELCLETLARSKRKPASHDNAVELLGWLELRHDPARDVVLVAVNESGELASKASDGWLPDSKRQELGLFDEAHRRARDAHAMHVLCSRTRSIRAIIARRNVKGDPISPSRLFLGSGGVQSACRITATMDDKVQSPRTVPAFALAGTPVPASKPCFDAPKPPASIEVTKLSVTAFASWIRSPMRFWLERLEGLESIDPEALELDPLAFGSLAHDVFQSFGEGQVHDSTDDVEIFAFLKEELDRLVARRYGRPCAPAIALQRATLRARFEHFAHVQAKAVLDGWHILESECTLEATLEIPDGESIQLRGRIDRIDRHEDGRLRVLDYKTSEKRTVPAKARTKSGIWHDLQLPLYHHLMRAQKDTSASEILVGYVSLCREPKEIDIEVADWNAEVMEEGIRRAQEIVQEMRSGEFSEGIAKPPRSVDAIARILRTGVLDIGTGFDADEAEVLD